MMSPEALAARYLDYYGSRGYVVSDPRSLISPLLPTSFLMSAGFQEIDNLVRGNNFTPQEMVVVQPCFRHFDALSTKHDTHLSLFLMGATLHGPNSEWSLRGVLETCLKFLVEAVGVQKDHLWLTTFSGTTFGGIRLPSNNEATMCWQQQGFSTSKTVELGLNENFWREGGPAALERPRYCGPQVEVFFDTTGSPCQGDCKPSCTCGRFLELANIISISYRFLKEDKIVPLLNPLCESVIGIERTLMGLEECKSIADLSYMKQELAHLLEEFPYIAKENYKPFLQVFEMLQAFCCLVSEGAKPGNKGRGSVLRRLFKLAIQTASTFEGNPINMARTIVDKSILQKNSAFGIPLKSHCDLIRGTFEQESSRLHIQ